MGKKKLKRPPQSMNQRRREEEMMQTFIGIAMQSRAFAMSRLVSELFEPDLGGKTLRLRGIGGATGVLSIERLNEVAQAILTEGVEVGGGAEGAARPADDGVGPSGEAQAEGDPPTGTEDPRRDGRASGLILPMRDVGQEPRPDAAGLDVGEEVDVAANEDPAR